MYDINFLDDEKIILISDNTIIYNNNGERICSSIITNKRYLVLDYPSSIHNSMEDLRISGKINYIRKKEVIFSINLSDIKEIKEDINYSKIIFQNKKYLLLNDNDIISYLKNKL